MKSLIELILIIIACFLLWGCLSDDTKHNCEEYKDYSGIHGGIYENTEPDVPIFSQVWVPPVYLNPDGTINEHAQSNCINHVDTLKEVPYPRNCLSSILVITDEPFIAYIDIFNDYGEKVHSSTQRFGFCGEFNNPFRMTQTGLYMVQLVWNMRDFDGKYAGPGIYTMKTKLNYPSSTEIKIKKFGLACLEGQPEPNCAK
jgi:hypothetical protein